MLFQCFGCALTPFNTQSHAPIERAHKQWISGAPKPPFITANVYEVASSNSHSNKSMYIVV